MVGFTEATNKILIAGDPVICEYHDGSTGAILPGDTVYINGTNTIDEGGAPTGTKNLSIGWALYEPAHDEWKPDTIATAYASGAFIPVALRGGPMVLRSRVVANVYVGSALMASAAGTGELNTSTIGTNDIMAIALEATTAAGLAMVLAI